jgi:hypothetical protein
LFEIRLILDFQHVASIVRRSPDPKEDIETAKIRFRWAEFEHAEYVAKTATEAKKKGGKQ